MKNWKSVQCTEVGFEGLITQLDDEFTSTQKSFEDRLTVHKELGGGAVRYLDCTVQRP